MARVEKLGGLDRLYDEWAAQLVQLGLLPSQAWPQAAPGQPRPTPWQHLQTLPRDGSVLNQDGVRYSNWRNLVNAVRDDTMSIWVDDLMGVKAGQAGVVLVFTYPDDPNHQLIITVSAQVVDPGKHTRNDTVGYAVAYTNFDLVGAKKQTSRAGDVSGTIGSGVLMVGGAGGYGVAGSKTTKRGAVLQTIAATDADGLDGLEIPSALHEVGIRYTWKTYDRHGGDQPVVTAVPPLPPLPPVVPVDGPAVEGDNAIALADLTPVVPVDGPALEGDNAIALADLTAGGVVRRPPVGLGRPQGSTRAQALLWQPQVWGDRGGLAPMPPLRDDGQPSVLNDVMLYTIAHTSGVGDLQEAVLRERPGREPEVWFGLSTGNVKTAGLRALGRLAQGLIGDEPVTLQIVPRYRPQIARTVYKPYSQIILESQRGRSLDTDANISHGRVLSGGLAPDPKFEPVNVPFSTFDATRYSGHGAGASQQFTAGFYRGIFGEDHYAVVRTAVDYVVTLSDGTQVSSPGEVTLLVRLVDVLKHTPRFDDPMGYLDRYRHDPKWAPPVPHTASDVVSWQPDALGYYRPPGSFVDGFTFSGVWPEHPTPLLTLGGESLQQALSRAVKILRGPGAVTSLATLASAVTIYLGELTDGGQSWEVEVDGRVLRLELWASTFGSPTRPDRGAGGLKLYERTNTQLSKRDQLLTDTGKALGLVDSFGHPGVDADDPWAVANLTGSSRDRVAHTGAHTTNLLTMSGLRLTGTVQFGQGMRIHYTLTDLGPAVAGRKLGRGLQAITDAGHRLTSPRLRQVSGHVDEIHPVYVPLAAVIAPGRHLPAYPFTLNNLIPPGAKVTGRHGLAAIYDAVADTRRGKDASKITGVHRDGTLAAFDTTALAQMLSTHGGLYTGVATGRKVLLLPDGRPARIRAWYTDVRHMYWVESRRWKATTTAPTRTCKPPCCRTRPTSGSTSTCPSPPRCPGCSPDPASPPARSPPPPTARAYSTAPRNGPGYATTAPPTTSTPASASPSNFKTPTGGSRPSSPPARSKSPPTTTKPTNSASPTWTGSSPAPTPHPAPPNNKPAPNSTPSTRDHHNSTPHPNPNPPPTTTDNSTNQPPPHQPPPHQPPPHQPPPHQPQP